MFTSRKWSAATLAAVAALLGCGCSDLQIVKPTESVRIEATMAEPVETRTCIDATNIGAKKSLPMKWTPGDALGVYTANDKNVKYTNSDQINNRLVGAFATVSDVQEVPQAAYYPYDSNNDGRDYTALTGNVPSVQMMNLQTGSIPGDYKYGVYKEKFSDGYQFTFHNIFSFALISVDATGTALSGESLREINLKVTRDGVAVPITGEFTFNASDGSYKLGSSTTNELSLKWSTNPVLNGTVASFASLFPEVRSGDILDFEFVTSGHTATLSVNAKVDFQPEYFYTFPLALSKFSNLNVTERKVKSGTFTCATYNVDGLPAKIAFVTVNEDGPGKEGTKKIAAQISKDNWDFFGVAEDFDNHDELTSGLPDFSLGTYGGNYSNSSTDGINLFWRKGNGVNASNETRVKFDQSYGGLTSGANTSITKGFRYYLVTLADGTQVDVYITHMNTYSSSGTGHINAQHAQLTQIANYIKSHRNGRPVILMGDTNCRYTRQQIKSLLIDAINSVDGLSINDPWVDYMWDGAYPAYPSGSMVTEDAPGKAADEIPWSNQQGEVVDKVFYINDTASPVQISATGYLRDTNYSGLADHLPIVIKFYYEQVQ